MERLGAEVGEHLDEPVKVGVHHLRLVGLLVRLRGAGPVHLGIPRRRLLHLRKDVQRALSVRGRGAPPPPTFPIFLVVRQTPTTWTTSPELVTNPCTTTGWYCWYDRAAPAPAPALPLSPTTTASVDTTSCGPNQVLVPYNQVDSQRQPNDGDYTDDGDRTNIVSTSNRHDFHRNDVEST